MPEDVWFHVDDLSSAHVYLRLKPGMTMDDIPKDCITDCCSLVKANSIAGCKQAASWIIYTRWKNLKKEQGFAPGQVTYHRPENVRRLKIEKNNPIVRQLEKSKREVTDTAILAKEQQDRLREIQQEKKAKYKADEKARKLLELERKKEKEARSYDRIMHDDKMTSNADMGATEDNTAAEDYEDDFM